MKDILTQSQIDELIGNINSNDEIIVPTKKDRVKVYDFKKPNKFTREQIRVFEDIYGNFSKIMSLKLSDQLRANCFLDVSYIEEQTFFEYTNSIPKSSLIGIYAVNNAENFFSLELSNSSAYGIIDLMLGGKGDDGSAFEAYTEIEVNLIKRVLNMFSKPVEDIWANYMELDIKLDRVENMGQHIQIAAPNDVIAIVTMKIEIAKKEGFINFCIPYLLVEPVLKGLSTLQKFSQTLKESDKSYEEYIKNEIVDNSVELTCKLGSAYITLEDIDKMQSGDVIKLQKKIGEKAELVINGKPKFLVDIGLSNDKYAMKLRKSIEGKE